MRVGLMGFGKTGRAVASVLLESNKVTLQWAIRQSQLLEHRSVPEFLGISSNANDPGFIYTRDEYSASELLDKHPIDILVDFSSNSGVDYYGDEAAQRGITIISAISQYQPEKIEKLQQLAEKTVVMHSPNITLGINFLIISAKILKNIAPFTDIEIIEEHFKSKPEVSGTAKIIAHNLDLPEASIKTIRAGGIIGVHEILFGFPYQTVRLKHESISREAFGNGILFAIANLKDKTQGFYNMEDLLLPYFHVSEEDTTLSISQKSWWKFWEK
ncbi:MAG: dihydrodipicolinate reductase C-terminal domain-containing protein [Thiofilum sp.]|uniref:4-hydroxy-tetrahydrodipicolinate reductase n=1 Tax=Thiofilum sp. TaxID=2212733 RepID=UPI0025EB7856|nr:dihydrodipicolinate reductase C-terminal domain-containing protein [Thiofilum sp.]MBK8454440.1 dihydrodipicolinate reductase [Thiofilum sp.]